MSDVSKPPPYPPVGFLVVYGWKVGAQVARSQCVEVQGGVEAIVTMRVSFASAVTGQCRLTILHRAERQQVPALEIYPVEWVTPSVPLEGGSFGAQRALRTSTPVRMSHKLSFH